MSQSSLASGDAIVWKKISWNKNREARLIRPPFRKKKDEKEGSDADDDGLKVNIKTYVPSERLTRIFPRGKAAVSKRMPQEILPPTTTIAADDLEALTERITIGAITRREGKLKALVRKQDESMKKITPKYPVNTFALVERMFDADYFTKRAIAAESLAEKLFPPPCTRRLSPTEQKMSIDRLYHSATRRRLDAALEESIVHRPSPAKSSGPSRRRLRPSSAPSAMPSLPTGSLQHTSQDRSTEVVDSSGFADLPSAGDTVDVGNGSAAAIPSAGDTVDAAAAPTGDAPQSVSDTSGKKAAGNASAAVRTLQVSQVSASSQSFLASANINTDALTEKLLKKPLVGILGVRANADNEEKEEPDCCAGEEKEEPDCCAGEEKEEPDCCAGEEKEEPDCCAGEEKEEPEPDDDEDDEIDGPQIYVKGTDLSAAVAEAIEGIADCCVLSFKGQEHMDAIPRDFVGKSISVRKLDLSKTGIVDLASVVDSFPSLEELVLEDISTSITDHFLAPLKKLEKLVSLQFGSAKDLKELPASLCELKLKKLGLNGSTALASVEALSSLPSLKSLGLAEIPATGNEVFVKNLVTSIPKGLTQLLLFGNKMKELPSAIGELVHLKDLNLYNNSMMKFPGELSKLVNLTELNMASNRLLQVPAEVLANLPNLKRLAAFWNNIVLCPSVASLHALATLELNGNKLEALPEFGSHPQLTAINFADNRIAEIGDIFSASRFPKLDTIDMGKNKLKILPPCIGALPSLVKINFADNQLESLPAELFDSGKLVTVMLSDNKISSIPDTISKVKESLCNLLLDRNQLLRLPQTMATFPSLTRQSVTVQVQLKGNPISCSDDIVLAMKKTVEAQETQKRWVGP